MLNTKLNLYDAEWLDVVFKDRNKAYGAYELRHHYGNTMVKAMGIAFTAVVALSLAYNFSTRGSDTFTSPLPKEDTIILKLADFKAERTPEAPKPAEPVQRSQPVSTIDNRPPVVRPDEVAQDPITQTELLTTTAQLGQTTTKGVDAQPTVEPVKTDSGEGTKPADDKQILDAVDVMPEPIGGAAAWGKFLSKNIHFPYKAQEAGKSGRVVMSFVIEKDGSLTDINVIGPAGYGMDEEALRVLKLAKPWKPGMQNGHPVRVRYNIPINFVLTDQE